jgi:SNF2 family DNA or RNA helicase
MALRRGVARAWLLSGNPTTRYADDLFGQLSLIWPQAFPSYWRFAERFCVLEDNVWSPRTKTIIGTRRNRDAMEENGDLVIVVNQEDVLDLPEYLFEVIDVDLGPKQQAAYRSMADEFVAQLGDGSEVVAQNEVARLLRLQQITSWWDDESAKHDALIDLLPTFEGPHLVWTHWRDGAEALHRRLHEAGVNVERVSGETNAHQRDLYLEAFKRGALDVLILSIGVGKFGHTFTNAKTVHYVDKTWNADDYFQSLRRVRRIGLKHHPVVVTYRAPKTTDELVELNLEGKLKPISRMTRSDLAELLCGLGRQR